jgi:SAM-dependent methyltransferase
VNNSLERFYESWSNKSTNMIDYINEAAVRKIDVILNRMPVIRSLKIKTMIDFGCGYGKALQNCAERLNLKKAYGFDFSEIAIKYAASNFGSAKLEYQRLISLDIDENIKFIKSITGGKVDCILLIDLLEHLPDCKNIMLKLSELSDLYIVKLPIEENLLSNYILRKEYPSTKQANGHLREFNANTVYYFTRKIGLTPIAEGIHIYDFRDSYPPPPVKLTLRQSLIRSTSKLFQMTIALLMPKKIYIRLFGPGSYYCVATFNREHILNP